MTEESAQKIEQSLTNLADFMVREARSNRHRTASRRFCLRYAPFLRELSTRISFCRELAALHITNELPAAEVLARVGEIVTRYRFPRLPPYDYHAWANLLAGAGLSLEPGLWIPWQRKQEIEVQFVYGGTLAQALRSPYSFPVIEGVTVPLNANLTPRELRERLVKFCVPAFQGFRKRISGLVEEALRPEFEVRILRYEAGETTIKQDPEVPTRIQMVIRGPGIRSSVIASFNVTLRKGQWARKVIGDIASRALPQIRDGLRLEHSAGRPADTKKQSRWWALAAIDGKSPREIASEDLKDKDAREDLAETIHRAFRRLGLSVPTE